MRNVHPLITRDPVDGGELVVTRLEGATSGVVIDGRFSLGWIGQLTPEQLEFVGLLVKNRGNIQKLAADLNIAYNTARNHLDEIVAALHVPVQKDEPLSRVEILKRLSAGEIELDEALHLLRQHTES